MDLSVLQFDTDSATDEGAVASSLEVASAQPESLQPSAARPSQPVSQTPPPHPTTPIISSPLPIDYILLRVNCFDSIGYDVILTCLCDCVTV